MTIYKGFALAHACAECARSLRSRACSLRSHAFARSSRSSRVFSPSRGRRGRRAVGLSIGALSSRPSLGYQSISVISHAGCLTRAPYGRALSGYLSGLSLLG